MRSIETLLFVSCLLVGILCIDDLDGDCANPCLEAVANGSGAGYFDCIGACIDAVNAGLAACDATANTCRTTYCQGYGQCTSPSDPPAEPDPDPAPEPDPVPDPEPEPEPPVVNPGNPTPPPKKCNYQYVSSDCPVQGTQGCLANGQKLVEGTAPTFNGCGPLASSLGLEAIGVALDTFAGDFQDSCNNHDICFGSCSFGDDSLFNTCDSNFLAQMLAACKANYPTMDGPNGGSVVRSARGAICVVQANFVYSTVQSGGCGAYGNAQNTHY